MARSFGNWLEQFLLDKEEIDPEDKGKIPYLLATAGLVHDLGNPPFGHYGEDIIKEWFKNYFKNENIKTGEAVKYSIGDVKQKDFLYFDGNAQTFRILTRLQFLNDDFGINFTYGTLSALIKYPWSSSSPKAQEKKKFGYFQQDKDRAEAVINETIGSIITMGGLNPRNPLTYLLEAADDICYLAADVEDAVKKNLIPWDKEFKNIYNTLKSKYPHGLKKLCDKHDATLQKNVPDHQLISVQNFRVWAQTQLFNEAKNVFALHYDKILAGSFEGKIEGKTDEKSVGTLLGQSENALEIKSLLENLMIEYVYPAKEVLTLELVGDSVITHLLNTFVKELANDAGEFKTKQRSGKLLKMISDNFLYVSKLIDNKPVKEMKDFTLYDKLILITDFISGMTDSYAVDLHQKLSGVKMP